jgi:hypothetical protein
VSKSSRSDTLPRRLYRCSTTDNATNANPGLPRQSERADHGQRRQACPAIHMSSISRDRTPACNLTSLSGPLLAQGVALRAAAGRAAASPCPSALTPSGPAATARRGWCTRTASGRKRRGPAASRSQVYQSRPEHLVAGIVLAVKIIATPARIHSARPGCLKFLG